MNDLTIEQFDEFFFLLWGKAAFSWQRQLAERVITNPDKPWPDAIALPTASGKTACIDIAVYALASQASRLEAGERRSAARRIFFVVDRRIIVDEAYFRARFLAIKLRDAKGGILKDVADRLRFLARGEHGNVDNEEPLAVFELRGGMYRSEAWARSPLQPAVVASTVDQLGSRLLFRAYGRGPGMRAVYAGLTANDSLILLDEAHCARPFLETLQAVNKYRNWAESSLVAPFYPVVMSATPPPDLKEVFRDESDEPNDPQHPLGKRQLASKPAGLRVVKAGKGKSGLSVFAQALVDSAESLIDDTRRAIVIFANRVATAREAYRILYSKYDDDATLLTGRMRSIDRDSIVEEKLRYLSSAKSSNRELVTPRFVVATQTLEVGADLDFDGLVTECASLDALRQRFGRLNRMGRPIAARAAIVVRSDQAENSDDDPVYGAALAKTWHWLNEHSGEENVIDFGINSMAGILPRDELIRDLNAEPPNAPVMLPGHIDCWVQTSPEPEPTPDVAPFLRGPEGGTADVQVCWRADIDLRAEGNEESLKDLLTLCPPSSPECLPVPIEIFKKWLGGNDQEDNTADVESFREGDAEPVQQNADETRRVILWRGRTEIKIRANPSDIRPGDTIVLPTYLAGYEALGDIPARAGSRPILDLGDRAHRQARAKAQLRLHPAVIDEWPDCAARDTLRLLAESSYERFMEDAAALADELREALSELAAAEETPSWLRQIAAFLTREKLDRLIKLHPLGGLILKGKKRFHLSKDEGERLGDEADRFSDEDDTASCGTVRVPLSEHLSGVASYAKRFATGCRLNPALVEVIEKTGSLHDLGKADPRFQSLLRNGSRWIESVLLAKSNDIPQGISAYRKAHKAACYPDGGRHELLSVRLAESEPSLLPDDEVLKDLTLHLIASHHGYCRPFAPVISDEQPVEVKMIVEGKQVSCTSETGLERLDSGVADRFWRLTRHYGWWGLAWLEAIFRLADHRRSEDEESEELKSEEANNE